MTRRRAHPRETRFLLRLGAHRPGRRGIPWACLVAAVAGAAGCDHEESRRDPLRIEWGAVSTSTPATRRRPEPRPETPEEAEARRKMRALHSPLELASSERPSEPAHTCRASGCHAELSPGSEIHSRVAATTCTRCHVPEGAPESHGFRTAETGGGICRTCHVPHAGISFVHQPVRESRCLACHDPHGRVEEKLLRSSDPVALCTGCHERTHAAVEHGPYVEGKCLTCHEAHESKFEKLTRSESAQLCLDCHDEEIRVEGRERPLTNMAALIRGSRFLHGPIRAGDCSSCHAAHTAESAHLLRKPYPDAFYQPWDPRHYALCFGCHASELATDARTSTKTGFRDGDLNLHHLHVNREKGRSCRACHEVHASNVPFHLRTSVPFGEWDLPIVYEQRLNGGVCKAGCHQEEDYDRTRPPPPDPSPDHPHGR